MHQQVQVYHYDIYNKAEEKTLDIHIDAEIVDASTQSLMKEWFNDETSTSFRSLRMQVENASPNTINVFINSPGGHVGDAMAIHDYLKEKEANGVRVERHGRGVVASASTYPLMGNISEMSENSFFMIHNVRGGIWGDTNQIENYARTMRKFNDTIRDFYARETGNAPETIAAWMNKETFMTAQEAKDRGFIKNVTGKTEFKNKISKEQWPFENQDVLNIYNSYVKENSDNNSNSIDMSKFKDSILEAFNEALEGLGIKNKLSEKANADVLENLSNRMEVAIKENGSGMTEDSVREMCKNVVTDILNERKFLTEESLKDLVKKSDLTNLITTDSFKTELTKELGNFENSIMEKISNALGNPTSGAKGKKKADAADDDEDDVPKNKLRITNAGVAGKNKFKGFEENDWEVADAISGKKTN